MAIQTVLTPNNILDETNRLSVPLWTPFKRPKVSGLFYDRCKIDWR
nr:MAG TPA: hypothetical protein [Caudoviricetes sp.]